LPLDWILRLFAPLAEQEMKFDIWVEYLQSGLSLGMRDHEMGYRTNDFF
jgi:hypothetical protein